MFKRTRFHFALYEFCDCFLCFQKCVWSCVVVLKRTIAWLNSPETLVQGFKSLNVQM
jgi:hypothetical protein